MKFNKLQSAKLSLRDQNVGNKINSTTEAKFSFVNKNNFLADFDSSLYSTNEKKVYTESIHIHIICRLILMCTL